ncbi:MAG: hypothetical protein IT555_02120 [Acetobacteraceae bacterium]|nr:hypothetical protein [Acetobacteraceae bacterium]
MLRQGGQFAGLEGEEELFQPGEDAREACQDHRGQGVGRPDAHRLHRGCGAQAGELVRQGFGMN